MSVNPSHDESLRVMLWSNPRTLSTVFLKCMSFVDNVQAINEPYVSAHIAGPDRRTPTNTKSLESTSKLFSEHKTKCDSVNIDLPNAFEMKDCTFQWVKDKLESKYTGKELIFCKDQAFGIHGRFHMLPKGYRHSFLIRNPYKIYPSWRKVITRMMPKGENPQFKLHELPEVFFPPKFGLGELFDLFEYVKANLDPNPIIIDADDLQNHPESILRQYCEATGVPFKESLLQWEAGDAITRTWIAASSMLRYNKVQDSGGYYDEALNSTCFKRTSNPPPGRDELPDDVLNCIDTVIPVFEKMYEMRLRP